MLGVHLLKSLRDGKQYIGSTIDIEHRFQQHNKGYVLSTKHRRPLILRGYQICDEIEEAAMLEKKYKRSHDVLLRAIKKGVFKLVE